MNQKSNRKEIFRRFLPWALTLLWMGLIFSFSSQNAEQSSHLSGQTAFHTAFWFWPGFSELSAEEQAVWVENAQFLVRKTAHFLVYAVLGALLYWSASSLKQSWRRKVVCAWSVGTVYAIGDEIHQLFVSGRSGQLRDVLLDSAGTAVGILLALFAGFLWKKAAGYTAAKQNAKKGQF
ncbi:MAG: VanZ family protein [Oscillospiraceae bacterium]